MRTASEDAVGVARFVILNPPADRSEPRVALEYVPPVIVAVDVNVPLIVAPAIVGVLTVGDVRVLETRVCAPPVPTISPVIPCALVAASCERKSVKSRADTPCSTVAPTECALELVPSTPRVTV